MKIETKSTISNTTYALIIGSVLLVAYALTGKSDQYFVDRVVKLSGNGHVCSGEQIIAPSGRNYILTAAHCAPLADETGHIEIEREDHSKTSVKIIAEDPMSDLLLLEPALDLDGLSVAELSSRGDDVRTFTHGRALDTYKTTGAIVQMEMPVQALVFPITDEAEMLKCASKPKFSVTDTFFGPFCLLTRAETVISAMIVPGSSGGPVLDASGRLIGVVSAGDGTFGYIVTLNDIRSFLIRY